MIYFIYNDHNEVKIGYSNDVRIQVGSPQRLKIIKIIDGAKQEEKRIHKRFNHLRIGGECFNLTEELSNYIESLSKTENFACKPELSGKYFGLTLAAMEREHIKHVLRLTGNNKSIAAVALGISRATLHSRLNKFKLFDEIQSLTNPSKL